MKYVYPACFYPEDNGRFSVVFVDFELATFGDDLSDAVYMAADAVSGRIITMLKDSEKLPPPSDPKKVKPDEPEGFVSLVYVDLADTETDHAEKAMAIA